MTTHNRNIKDAISQLSGSFGRDVLYVQYCTVDSVDEAAQTCDCTPISGDQDTQIIGVLLNSEANPGFTLFPAIDSTVIVAVSSKNIPFVILTEEIDKVFIIPETSIQLFDGSFGGLTKTQELKTQLDKNNQLLQELIDIINGAPINEPGSGSPSALQAALKIAITGKSLGDYSNIENTKIIHGQ